MDGENQIRVEPVLLVIAALFGDVDGTWPVRSVVDGDFWVAGRSRQQIARNNGSYFAPNWHQRAKPMALQYFRS
jgi:hypothetical protein